MLVGVIDYGVGNVGSVLRALEELRVTPVLLGKAEEAHSVNRLILPGVGNFTDCVQLLRVGGWEQALLDEVQGAGKPLLGICLGMQLLANFGMEGAAHDAPEGTLGLGFIPGRVESLRTLGCGLRVPHVGWNEVESRLGPVGMFNGVPNGTDFYFVHSYAFVPEDPMHLMATTRYDINVAAAVRRGHIWGAQFHPEKSSRAGFQILRNFIENSPC
jgi:glutamine amidotransferase